MPNPLSMDLRTRAVNAVLNGEGSHKEIAKRFSISYATLREYLNRLERDGTFEPKPRSGGRIHKKVFDHHVQAIKGYLDERSDLTNKEIVAKLKDDFDLELHPCQISRILKREGITRKKKSASTPR